MADRAWKACVVCGENFEPARFHPKQKTCSKACCDKRYRSVNRIGKLEKDKRYREERWFDGRREEVLCRDGYKCANCGSTKNLHIHHIDGNGRGSEKPNNDIGNLVTLCFPCHRREHAVKMTDKENIKCVTQNWHLSNRELARRLGVSHPTVAEIRGVINGRSHMESR